MTIQERLRQLAAFHREHTPRYIHPKFGEQQTATMTSEMDEAADRIDEIEAALRELLDTFNPEPRMDDIGLIWGRAAAALKGNV